MRDMPEHLPELPEDAVYIGQGGDVPHDFRGELWCCHERVGDWRYVECDFSLVHHYAAPIDSDLGRKILAERSKPSWAGAPDWAEWLAQDENGEWWWFEREPTVQTDAQGSFWNPIRGEACEASDGGEGNAHNWRTTLERRPESTKVGKLHVKIDPSEVRRALDEALDELPDLCIPRDAAELMNAAGYTEALVEIGYGVVFDKDGIRGWKE